METPRELFQIMTRRLGFLNKDCCSVGGCNLSAPQSQLLYEIDRSPEPSMQQVAETLGTDITTFSRQVQSLVKMNLVKKTPNPTDRRIFTLALTPEGKMVATTIDHQMNEYLNEAFSRMSEFEVETLLRSIKLFNESMGKLNNCCAPVKG
ncbi:MULTISPECIES: MarR family winged helix-turn-helix transcriptional regulator [unclassified Paenibacillus]|uniref:MarR family winged helix-turn-helix transcriptional regulator n=1 Tax=unclassified Paenibacillus TaxID=185978 RepID=UPI002406867C|nr:MULTISPECIES: MarR family winged helix-turn-helix transcriptional regulator [unclassified Paenibacillus]MDF9839540.1 DNA-binding MarR family transcriptional regulator [Paenibacillus sp. PastF-2]MDF9846121.1 DNA-binding MarR family transcriptional regulator [Paenibacillus sp. PastM-2]MDF9852693.1 DNA-binding MarR family transcriptional regulator [Paenibacillus sp. PastF-1]MDH6477576.1 DNA-binding MarR family transcriptional regulator [Paenibacillus sp. PastH-2]